MSQWAKVLKYQDDLFIIPCLFCLKLCEPVLALSPQKFLTYLLIHCDLWPTILSVHLYVQAPPPKNLMCSFEYCLHVYVTCKASSSGGPRGGGIVCVRNRLKQMCLWSKHRRSRNLDGGQTKCSVKGSILFVPSEKKLKELCAESQASNFQLHAR